MWSNYRPEPHKVCIKHCRLGVFTPTLIRGSLSKMVAILQTTIWYSFSWMNIVVYWQKSHIKAWVYSLHWRHNGQDSVSIHQPHECLFDRLFRRRSKKYQSSTSLAFVWGIHRRPVNSPHKWPVTRKMFTLDDVIMDAYYINKLTDVLDGYVWYLYINMCCSLNPCIWHEATNEKYTMNFLKR